MGHGAGRAKPRWNMPAAARREIAYGKWRVGDQQVLRKLGPVRSPAARDGLTKTMAEARLREVMSEVVAPIAERSHPRGQEQAGG